MKKFNVNELKSGCIIAHKKGLELELQYSGWTNGKIWGFYCLTIDNEEDDGSFSYEQKRYLTTQELNDWYIID